MHRYRRARSSPPASARDESGKLVPLDLKPARRRSFAETSGGALASGAGARCHGDRFCWLGAPHVAGPARGSVEGSIRTVLRGCSEPAKGTRAFTRAFD
jgi:hypothetical protein